MPVVRRQLAAYVATVDRLAEDGRFPERQCLEPRERLDVAAASARISLDELRARREAVQRGDGRRPERILSAARFAVGRNEVPDVGAWVADRAHLPVEHRSHSL